MKKIAVGVWLAGILLLQPGGVFSMEMRSQDDGVQPVIAASSPFGVLDFLQWNDGWNNHHYPDADALKQSACLMKEAGVSWVRMDFLWEDIEPAQGTFAFDKYDAIVDVLASNGINILGIWNYSASWAASNGNWNSAPKDNSLFVAYVTQVVRRYKDKVKYWELWNEPDSPTYWQPQDGLVAYCGLLKEVYKAVKKEDPQCQILNGGFAQGFTSVHKLYENGAKDYFDILNIHIFENPAYPGAARRVACYPPMAKKIMERNGDGHKQLWVTEIGCPGVRNRRVPQWWMGKNPTERIQARWVSDVYGALLKHPTVGKVFWAFFRDTNKHWDSGVDYFGLVRNDFTRKPALRAYKKCVLDILKADK